MDSLWALSAVLVPMQMVVLPSSGGLTRVAPMLFTSQLTLFLFVNGCCLTLLAFAAVSSEWLRKVCPTSRLRRTGGTPGPPKRCKGGKREAGESYDPFPLVP